MAWPQAKTPTQGPPKAREPLIAAWSIPSAKPDTTVIFSTAVSKPSIKAL